MKTATAVTVATVGGALIGAGLLFVASRRSVIIQQNPGRYMPQYPITDSKGAAAAQWAGFATQTAASLISLADSIAGLFEKYGSGSNDTRQQKNEYAADRTSVGSTGDKSVDQYSQVKGASDNKTSV